MSVPATTPVFGVEKSLLRFTTAGSVDDGKSTLIGRLLVDSKSVYEDQLNAIRKASAANASTPIDFSLLTDGLRAEREQGITIDVAYRYFATPRRKFIIADTPGHEQYTRNMATGASTADLAVILIDARQGVLPQSRRHACISALLGIPSVVVAVNKMDLAGYDRQVFNAIRDEFSQFLSRLGVRDFYVLPISALAGDNVVHRSLKMGWFQGPSLLDYLETVDVAREAYSAPFRFPVQRVVRPDQTFRGYSGQIAAGSVRPGDPVLVFPSGRRTHVKSIVTFDGDLNLAFAPMSVTLTLEDEVDISRGDMLASVRQAPKAARRFEAAIVWMDAKPLATGQPYLLKHTSQTVAAEVKRVEHRVNIYSLDPEPTEGLEMNGIGVVAIETAQPIFFDPYSSIAATGSFILIDPVTNGTVAAGMIRRSLEPARTHTVETEQQAAGRVTPAERIARYGHHGVAVPVGPRPELAHLLERRLFALGCAVAVLPEWNDEAVEALESAGLIALVITEEQVALPSRDEPAAEHILSQLARDGDLLTGIEAVDGGGGI